MSGVGKEIRVLNYYIFNDDDDKILDLIFVNNIYLATIYQSGTIIVRNIYLCIIDKIENNQTGKYFAIDFFKDSADLIYSEDKVIKILNNGLFYSNENDSIIN